MQKNFKTKSFSTFSNQNPRREKTHSTLLRPALNMNLNPALNFSTNNNKSNNNSIISNTTNLKTNPNVSSAYSLRRHNNNNNNKVNSVYQKIPSTTSKLISHINLTRTIQSIPRSSQNNLSHSKNNNNNISNNSSNARHHLNINTNYGIGNSSFSPPTSHNRSLNSNSNYFNTNNNYYNTNSNNNSHNNTISNIHYSNTSSINHSSQKSEYFPSLTENIEINKYTKYNILNNNNNNISRNLLYANLNNVRISHKKFGIIHSYATITCSGKRDYNEDRVSIIYNIPKPSQSIGNSDISKDNNNNNIKSTFWPSCSFFGLYDGHGGSGACDFLRDNLHKYIISDKNFPSNPQKAIANGFIRAEKIFIKNSLTNKTSNNSNSNNNQLMHDSSGSCALVVLVIENRVYIANVGDSRAVLSAKNGTKIYSLSRDHRPGDEAEYKRILEAGGKIYKTEYEANKTNINIKISNTGINKNNNINNNNKKTTSSIMGPLRVLPGKLSVSRTIGDIEAKDPRFGGNPNVIIAIPEIKYFDNNDKNDFIIIGCDGIFEKLKNKEIMETLWKNIKRKNFPDVHNMSGYVIEELINDCLSHDSNDNLTLIMICLKDYNQLKNDNINGISNNSNIPQTENIEINKSKKTALPERKSVNNNNSINTNNTSHYQNNSNLGGNIGNNISKNCNNRRPLSKQTLSALLTKLNHNNSQNMKKIVCLKSNGTGNNTNKGGINTNINNNRINK